MKRLAIRRAAGVRLVGRAGRVRSPIDPRAYPAPTVERCWPVRRSGEQAGLASPRSPWTLGGATAHQATVLSWSRRGPSCYSMRSTRPPTPRADLAATDRFRLRRLRAPAISGLCDWRAIAQRCAWHGPDDFPAGVCSRRSIPHPTGAIRWTRARAEVWAGVPGRTWGQTLVARWRGGQSGTCRERRHGRGRRVDGTGNKVFRPHGQDGECCSSPRRLIRTAPEGTSEQWKDARSTGDR